MTIEELRDDAGDTDADQRVEMGDRNLTTTTKPFRRALNSLDLSGLTVFELGCGEGHLLRLLRDTDAETVYAFEIQHDKIADDIKAWAADENAKPRLVINPPEFKINPDLPDGDFTNYDFLKLLDNNQDFAIVGNPPYFLWNRILSLTGEYLTEEDGMFEPLQKQFKGALALTSENRLGNHPGWEIKAVLQAKHFKPRPESDQDQCIIQTGFEGRIKEKTSAIDISKRIPRRYRPEGPDAPIVGASQRRVAIWNRDPAADPSDCYRGWGDDDDANPGQWKDYVKQRESELEKSGTWNCSWKERADQIRASNDNKVVR